jgi:hypothetical protein
MIHRKEPEPTEEKIARRAHELYVRRGGAHGKDVEDWVRAEEELWEERIVRLASTATATLGSRMAVN